MVGLDSVFVPQTAFAMVSKVLPSACLADTLTDR
jgi:hypothetical protein